MSGLRQEKMRDWLAGLNSYALNLQSIEPASSDASFRRYFRVGELQGAASYVVMDAPPDKEDTRPFVNIAKSMREAGVLAPDILADNEAEGFLLLTDFGNTTMLSAIKANEDDADSLYRKAMADLVAMQVKVPAVHLPVYDAARLQAEMDLFDQWFVQKHCKSLLTEQEAQWMQGIYAALIESALAEQQVFVHRDYHSRNLMVLGEGEDRKLGMIDFQDAVAGPLSYDLVSILRDAYVEWPEDVTLDWAIRYWEQARKAGLQVPADPSEFYRQFDFMGLQRHLKILGIFARLYYRDGKDQYLNDLPLVLGYVRQVASRYIAFKPLLLILERLENREVKVGYTF